MLAIFAPPQLWSFWTSSSKTSLCFIFQRHPASVHKKNLRLRRTNWPPTLLLYWNIFRGGSGGWLMSRSLAVVVHSSCGSNSCCGRLLSELSDSDLLLLLTFLPLTFEAQLCSSLCCFALNWFLLLSPHLPSPDPPSFSRFFSSPLWQQSKWQPFVQPGL